MTALDRARALIAETEGHTPGPWRVSDDPRAVTSKRGKVLRAQVHAIYLMREDAIANARLAAAAPDLRAALAEMVAENERLREALATLIESCESSGADDHLGPFCLPDARAALTGDTAHD